MPARIRGLNVLALLVGTSKAVPLQMVLGLTFEGCAGSHRDHWLPIILPEGVMGGCYGRCADDSKKFQPGCPRISVLKKVSPDRQHESAWWTRACQLAAQSPRGEIVTAQRMSKLGVYTRPKKNPQYSGVLRYTIAEYEGVNRLFHI